PAYKFTTQAALVTPEPQMRLVTSPSRRFQRVSTQYDEYIFDWLGLNVFVERLSEGEGRFRGLSQRKVKLSRERRRRIAEFDTLLNGIKRGSLPIQFAASDTDGYCRVWELLVRLYNSENRSRERAAKVANKGFRQKIFHPVSYVRSLLDFNGHDTVYLVGDWFSSERPGEPLEEPLEDPLEFARVSWGFEPLTNRRVSRRLPRGLKVRRLTGLTEWLIIMAKMGDRDALKRIQKDSRFQPLFKACGVADSGVSEEVWQESFLSNLPIDRIYRRMRKEARLIAIDNGLVYMSGGASLAFPLGDLDERTIDFIHTIEEHLRNVNDNTLANDPYLHGILASGSPIDSLAEIAPEVLYRLSVITSKPLLLLVNNSPAQVQVDIAKGVIGLGGNQGYLLMVSQAEGIKRYDIASGKSTLILEGRKFERSLGDSVRKLKTLELDRARLDQAARSVRPLSGIIFWGLLDFLAPHIPAYRSWRDLVNPFSPRACFQAWRNLLNPLGFLRDYHRTTAKMIRRRHFMERIIRPHSWRAYQEKVAAELAVQRERRMSSSKPAVAIEAERAAAAVIEAGQPTCGLQIQELATLIQALPFEKPRAVETKLLEIKPPSGYHMRPTMQTLNLIAQQDFKMLHITMRYENEEVELINPMPILSLTITQGKQVSFRVAIREGTPEEKIPEATAAMFVAAVALEILVGEAEFGEDLEAAKVDDKLRFRKAPTPENLIATSTGRVGDAAKCKPASQYELFYVLDLKEEENAGVSRNGRDSAGISPADFRGCPAHIARRLSGPIQLFDPRRDIRDPLERQILTYTLMLIENEDFNGKEALVNVLNELRQHRRICWADNLPGTSRAQLDVFGKFYILINSDFRWLFEPASLGARSPPERRALFAFLAAKLLHEAAEILISSAPGVYWELGNDDSSLVNTEVIAYRTELRFLSILPSFLRDFHLLLNAEANPPLLQLYEEALRLRRTDEPSVILLVDLEHRRIKGFLEKLGLDTEEYNYAHTSFLETHLLSMQEFSLVALEHRMQPIQAGCGRNADAESSSQRHVRTEASIELSQLPPFVIGAERHQMVFNFLPQRERFAVIRYWQDNRPFAYWVTYPDKEGRLCLRYGIRSTKDDYIRKKFLLELEAQERLCRGNVRQDKKFDTRSFNQAHRMWAGMLFQEELPKQSSKSLLAFCKVKERLDLYGEVMPGNIQGALSNFGYEVGHISSYYRLYCHYLKFGFHLGNRFAELMQQKPEFPAFIDLLNEARQKDPDFKLLNDRDLEGVLVALGFKCQYINVSYKLYQHYLTLGLDLGKRFGELRQQQPELLAFMRLLEEAKEKDSTFGLLKAAHLEVLLVGLGYKIRLISTYYALRLHYFALGLDLGKRFGELLICQSALFAFADLLKEAGQRDSGYALLNAANLEGVLFGLGYQVVYISSIYKIYLHWQKRGIDVAELYDARGFDETKFAQVLRLVTEAGLPEGHFSRSIDFYLNATLILLAKYQQEDSRKMNSEAEEEIQIKNEYFDGGSQVDADEWEYMPGNRDMIRMRSNHTIIAKRRKDGKFAIFSGGETVDDADAAIEKAETVSNPNGKRGPSQLNPRYPRLYEFNMPLVGDFSKITNEQLGKLKEDGYDGIWLMGVWEKSDYSRRLNEYWGKRNKPEQKRIASSYAVSSYEVDENLGGEKALRDLVARANKLGLTVFLDIVTNAMAADTPLALARPQLFNRPHEDIRRNLAPGHELTAEISGNGYYFFRHPAFGDSPEGVFSHAIDPDGKPWVDTIGFNHYNSETQAFLREIILKAADLTNGGGIRFDMVSLSFNALKDFWPKMNAELKKAYPGIVLLAESYEGSGDVIFNLGFDFYYEACFNEALRKRDINKLKWCFGAIQNRGRFNLLKYLENHDILERIMKTLGKDAALAAAVLLFTFPGASLIYQGQDRGWSQFMPSANCICGPEEKDDPEVMSFYHQLGRITAGDVFKNGDFRLFEGELEANPNVIGFLREFEGRRAIVVVNYASWQNHVKISLDGQALEFDLPAWGSEIFENGNGLFSGCLRTKLEPALALAHWAIAPGKLTEALQNAEPGAYLGDTPETRLTGEDINELKVQAASQLIAEPELQTMELALTRHGWEEKFTVERFSRKRKFVVPTRWSSDDALRAALAAALVQEDINGRLASDQPYLLLPAKHILSRDDEQPTQDHLAGDHLANHTLFIHESLPGVVAALNDTLPVAGELFYEVVLGHELRHEVRSETGPQAEAEFRTHDIARFRSYQDQNPAALADLTEALAFRGLVTQEFASALLNEPETMYEPEDNQMAEMLVRALVNSGIITHKSRVLEIGTGTGILTKALADAAKARGLQSVKFVATDISLHGAVRLARQRLASYDNVTVRHGDLDAALLDDESFDVIFWNPPWFPAPTVQKKAHKRTWLDPGYRTLRAYLESMSKRLTAGGRLYVVFPHKRKGALVNFSRQLSLDMRRVDFYRTLHFKRIIGLYEFTPKPPSAESRESDGGVTGQAGKDAPQGSQKFFDLAHYNLYPEPQNLRHLIIHAQSRADTDSFAKAGIEAIMQDVCPEDEANFELLDVGPWVEGKHYLTRHPSLCFPEGRESEKFAAFILGAEELILTGGSYGSCHYNWYRIVLAMRRRHGLRTIFHFPLDAIYPSFKVVTTETIKRSPYVAALGEADSPEAIPACIFYNGNPIPIWKNSDQPQVIINYWDSHKSLLPPSSVKRWRLTDGLLYIPCLIFFILLPILMGMGNPENSASQLLIEKTGSLAFSIFWRIILALAVVILIVCTFAQPASHDQGSPSFADRKRKIAFDRWVTLVSAVTTPEQSDVCRKRIHGDTAVTGDPVLLQQLDSALRTKTLQIEKAQQARKQREEAAPKREQAKRPAAAVPANSGPTVAVTEPTAHPQPSVATSGPEAKALQTETHKPAPEEQARNLLAEFDRCIVRKNFARAEELLQQLKALNPGEIPKFPDLADKVKEAEAALAKGKAEFEAQQKEIQAQYREAREKIANGDLKTANRILKALAVLQRDGWKLAGIAIGKIDEAMKAKREKRRDATELIEQFVEIKHEFAGLEEIERLIKELEGNLEIVKQAFSTFKERKDQPSQAALITANQTMVDSREERKDAITTGLGKYRTKVQDPDWFSEISMKEGDLKTLLSEPELARLSQRRGIITNPEELRTRVVDLIRRWNKFSHGWDQLKQSIEVYLQTPPLSSPPAGSLACLLLALGASLLTLGGCAPGRDTAGLDKLTLFAWFLTGALILMLIFVSFIRVTATQHVLLKAQKSRIGIESGAPVFSLDTFYINPLFKNKFSLSDLELLYQILHTDMSDLENVKRLMHDSAGRIYIAYHELKRKDEGRTVYLRLEQEVEGIKILRIKGVRPRIINGRVQNYWGGGFISWVKKIDKEFLTVTKGTPDKKGGMDAKNAKLEYEIMLQGKEAGFPTDHPVGWGAFKVRNA
ncbi:MAG: alpha-amylase family glycosyl hydrolase, partial [Candidatus Omnitrophica bacterium]|nr:alpha-amylase family glycosyl hydrolase [Candidatus Omnitrophota bacterium]